MVEADPVLPKSRDIALAEVALVHMSKFMAQGGNAEPSARLVRDTIKLFTHKKYPAVAREAYN